jgi:hypothetical protein
MRKQCFRRALAVAGFIGASAVVLSADTYRTALPGTVNYVEGQVSINGQLLNTRQDGNTLLRTDQSLVTGNGKVEMLLSPGVFVRQGSNSEIRMVSPGLADPAIEVVRGSAMVEVDQKPKDAHLNVVEHGATASILKQGLYRFDSDQGRVAVVDGKVRVSENGSSKEFGKGKQVLLNGEPLKTVSFDRKAEDDLYRWSSVRSGYLAEANASTARRIYGGYGAFAGNGWYWNRYFAAWSWLPGDGYFFSPFGYPFYSPGFVAYAPFYGGFGYRGAFRGVNRGAFEGRGFAGGRTGVNLGSSPGFTRGAGGGFTRGGGGFARGGGHR